MEILEDVIDCFDNKIENDNISKKSTIDETDWTEIEGYSVDDNSLRFKMLKNCSMLGRDLLMDSDGYSYNLKADNRRKSVVWICRNRAATKKNPIPCYAQVSQVGQYFIPGKHNHICNPVPSKSF